MITKVIFNYNTNFMLERHQNWIQVNQKHLHTTEYLSKVSDATFIYSFSTVTEWNAQESGTLQVVKDISMLPSKIDQLKVHHRM